MPSLVDAGPSTPATSSASELLVLWQHPESRAMVPVAILSFDGSHYRFKYLPAAERLDGFRPLLGFRDLSETYESDELFPLFKERVLDPTRPDFHRVLERLDLDSAHATPWEQLVRTGGVSEGDTLQVTPFPHESDEGWSCTVLAAGLRYLMIKSVATEHRTMGPYAPDDFEAHLGRLRTGDLLSVEREIGNRYNEAAQLLIEAGEVIGYLPDWLARLTAPLIEAGEKISARVMRVNDPAAGWHLRLLVEVRAGEAYEAADRRLRTDTFTAY